MPGVRGRSAAAQTLAEGRAGLSSGTSRVGNLRRLVSAHRSSLARAPLSALGADPGTPEPRLGRAFQVQNDRVIEADRQPGILARMLGSMLQTARKTAGLSYDQAAPRGVRADPGEPAQCLVEGEQRPYFLGGPGRVPGAEDVQVRRGGVSFEPGVVPGHSALAELEPASPPGGDLGDGPLDVGPVRHVVLAQSRACGPVRAGGAQQLSCSCRCRVRPSLALVHRWRSGQSRQATPKMTAFLAVTCRMIPAGQVTVPHCAVPVAARPVSAGEGQSHLK